MSAGWYPDPSGRFEYRYHNGTAWTADVSTAGQRFVDGGLGGAPTPGAAPARNGMATASLVCGVVALAICWLPVLFVGGAVLAVLALVFGFVGLRRSSARDGAGRGFAVAGLLTGGFGLVGAVGGLVLTLVTFGALDRYENPADHTVAIDRCEVEGSRVVLEGTLRNDSDDDADFTVFVEVRRAGTDDAVLRARREVDDVAPGATARFGAEARTQTDDVECEVLDVTGPLPFGIAP